VIGILAASSPGEVRVAAIANGVLQDYSVWRPGRPDGVGDVYRARVIAHVPGLAGAFVGLPDAEGFLPDSEGGAGAVEGALLTVRVTRASQGGKGPRLTAKLPQSPGEPGLLARGPSPIEEYASRYPDAHVAVDDPALAAQLRPAFGARIATVSVAFDDGLADEIAALSQQELLLPGGMRASVQPTPALVAIDLDMGAATEGRLPKPAAQLAANLGAVPELARQIRLRNLCGAILIDLAGMSSKRRALLGPALTGALSADPLRPRFLGFTALGLAEIVRPRVHPPLHELLSGPHAAGLAALRAIARESAAAPHAHWGLSAAPDVVDALERDSVALPDLARRTGRPLIPVPDPNLAAGSWRIESFA
jgi:Ribonuclease G/E